METAIQEPIIEEKSIAIDDQLTIFKDNTLADARANQSKNIRITYEKKQTE